MTPAPHDMPVIDVTGPRLDHTYVVALPGSVYVVAKSRAEVERLVSKHAPGSAIRFVQR